MPLPPLPPLALAHVPLTVHCTHHHIHVAFRRGSLFLPIRVLSVLLGFYYRRRRRRYHCTIHSMYRPKSEEWRAVCSQQPASKRCINTLDSFCVSTLTRNWWNFWGDILLFSFKESVCAVCMDACAWCHHRCQPNAHCVMLFSLFAPPFTS